MGKPRRGQKSRIPVSSYQWTNLKRHSVQSMFVTQPPAKNIGLDVEFADHEIELVQTDDGLYYRRREFAGTAKLFDEKGIRLGQVISAVDEMKIAEATGSITLYLNGVMEASERDEEVVRQRNVEWHRAQGIK